jgi:hypothetical protein
MPNRNHHDGFGLFVKNDTPVTDPKPCADLAFQLLYVTMTGRREDIEFLTNAVPDLWGKFEPLTRCGCSENDLPPFQYYRIMRY